MNKLTQIIKRFIVSDDGPTAVEYAVMLALILLACIAAVQALGTTANSAFQSVGTAFGS